MKINNKSDLLKYEIEKLELFLNTNAKSLTTEELTDYNMQKEDMEIELNKILNEDTVKIHPQPNKKYLLWLEIREQTLEGIEHNIYIQDFSSQSQTKQKLVQLIIDHHVTFNGSWYCTKRVITAMIGRKCVSGRYREIANSVDGYIWKPITNDISGKILKINGDNIRYLDDNG